MFSGPLEKNSNPSLHNPWSTPKIEALSTTNCLHLGKLKEITPGLARDQHQPDLLYVGVVVELIVLHEVLVLPAHHLQHRQALLGRHVAQTLARVRCNHTRDTGQYCDTWSHVLEHTRGSFLSANWIPQFPSIGSQGLSSFCLRTKNVLYYYMESRYI